MSAIFNFQSLISVILLLICTCAYIRAFAPKVIDRNKEGLLGVFWKCARIGERLSPWVAASCFCMAFVKGGRVNENHYEINRQQPAKPFTGPNHFFITRKTNVESQYSDVYIHGMGASINSVLVFVVELEKLFAGALISDVQTSTIHVTDNLFPMSDEFEAGDRSRPLSAVHVHLYRAMFCKTVYSRIRNLSINSFRRFTRPRLAIVGSGPAGMFTCNALLRRTNFAVDVFENYHVPFGLVRYGVAPDHQEVKNCINLFDNMFDSNKDRLRLFCNVNIGKDVTFEELTNNYNSVLLAYGSYKTRSLAIPGEKSLNVLSGSEFVGWYNGVPNVANPSLDGDSAVIIGNGNVALDCARIISMGADGSLKSSDIPDDRLAHLQESKIRNIKVLGRRGPGDVSFTIKELREQFKLAEWSSAVDMSREDEETLRSELPKFERKKKRLTELLLKFAGKPNGPRQCHFLFNRVPQEVLSDSCGRVKAIKVFNKYTNETETVPCSLLIYSIGYQTLILDGVPQNAKGMIDMKDECRVNIQGPTPVYATGWCAHGPRGVIVDTQQQSAFVAEQIAKDFENFNGKTAVGADVLLKQRHVRSISWDRWKFIDNEEKLKGQKSGKIREKFTTFDSFVN
ncbi:unnamed protein product [Caenorhabditis auriculariae]|uniref:FAD/NAD(P)-binding domain-containing protein n=1 Tax=Caenorhabditis auriculariae TaxID=2777116 RepID=A0A8S1HBG4_9PELO|nr:unnamed protein product [Caenorhabditis auriculariae]